MAAITLLMQPTSKLVQNIFIHFQFKLYFIYAHDIKLCKTMIPRKEDLYPDSTELGQSVASTHPYGLPLCCYKGVKGKTSFSSPLPGTDQRELVKLICGRHEKEILSKQSNCGINPSLSPPLTTPLPSTHVQHMIFSQ